MPALESTISTLRRTHLFLFLAAISVLLLSFPSGPDYDRALAELASLRTLVSDEVYGAHCAEQFLADQTAVWSEVRRYARSRADGLPIPDSVPFGGMVHCRRPSADAELEAYARFLTSPQYLEFPAAAVEELYSGIQRLLEADQAAGTFTFAQLVLPGASGGSVVMTDLPYGYAPVQFIEASSTEYREALRAGRDSLMLAGTFRQGNRSGGPSVRVPGRVATRSSSITPLDWASEQEAYGRLIEKAAGSPAVLPGLQPFWDAVRSSTLPEAARYIQSLAGRDGIMIEALGLEVGLVTLGLVGPLVLLALVMHMVLHTRHLARLHVDVGEARQLPWVALFPDELSRASTWVTILLLPTAASIAIGVRAASDSPLVALWAVASTAALGLLATSILREVKRLGSEAGPDPKDADLPRAE